MIGVFTARDVEVALESAGQVLGLREGEVTVPEPGRVLIAATLPAWSWVAFGLWHRWARRALRSVVEPHLPVGVTLEVRVR